MRFAVLSKNGWGTPEKQTSEIMMISEVCFSLQ
jgi:hypothetical protein